MSRNDRQSFLCVGIVALSVVLVAAPPAAGQCLGDTTGATCLCVDGTSNPTICAKWTGQGEPDHPDDFTVDFECTGCSTQPDIELSTGGTSAAPLTWTLWSFDDADAYDLGNIGDITIDATTLSDDFDVKIERPGPGPGAWDVKSINLHDETNWTGHSNITGGAIWGNLTGDLTVIEDTSFDGGSVDLTIYGSVEGTLTIENLVQLTVGSVAAGGVINIETIDGTPGVTSLVVLDDVAGAINITTFDGGQGNSPAEITVGGDVTGTGTIDIVSMVGDRIAFLPPPGPPELQIDGSVSGTLSFGTVVNADISIGDSADMTNGNLSGDIVVTGTLSITHVQVWGDVTSSGRITVADMDSGGYRGWYSGILLNGAHGDMGGRLVLDNGIPFEQEVEISGLLTSTGFIDLKGKDVVGRLEIEHGGSGAIVNGGIITATGTPGEGSCFYVDCEVILGSAVGDTFSGQASFTGVASDGVIIAQDVDGSIKFVGDMAGTFAINGTLGGTGNVYITGNLTSTGTLSVGEDVTGDIDITGDHDGTIAVTGSLTRPGRIMVNGGADGDIIIGELNGALTLITMLAVEGWVRPRAS
ncbi:MAG: hypothetical protein IID36_11280 [Planctomycetes bacterium]|nr:hypothetical protein [Planctomycetota bacterium]